MTALPPCNTCGGIQYHWTRYLQARLVAGTTFMTSGFAVEEARRFYKTHASDPRWTPDGFDRNAMRALGVDPAQVRVPDGDTRAPGSIPDARRTAGQTHDGHHPGQPCCAPLLHVGDRARISPNPFFTYSGRWHTATRAENIAGAECRVDEGPDHYGDYKILTDSLIPAWVHGSCLTKIEEAES